MYRIIGADQKQYGPITLDQVRQWLAEGRLNAQSKIQAEGSGIWRSAIDFPEFAGFFGAAPSSPMTMPPPLGAARKTSQMAVWALVTGIISIIPCCCFIGPLPLILGLMAQSTIKKEANLGGGGMAVAGIVLGSIGICIFIVVIFGWLTNPQVFSGFQGFPIAVPMPR